MERPPGSQGASLRIIAIEDVATDAELIERELHKSGFSFSMARVETKDAFLTAVEDRAPDLILSDYSLPAFDGLTALTLTRERYPDVPFIFVSGTIGEELAIETLKGGATDYVLKHRLSRLGPAVERALREVRERAERKHAEALFLARYAEKAGSGILDMIARCKEAGLPAPQFRQEGGQFIQTLWRPPTTLRVRGIPSEEAVGAPTVKLRTTAAVSAQVTAEVAAQVLWYCREPRPAKAIMAKLRLKHWKTFQRNYLNPLLNRGWLERTIPEKPRSRLQRYRTTKAGLEILEEPKR